jgi:hypothetical protein
MTAGDGSTRDLLNTSIEIGICAPATSANERGYFERDTISIIFASSSSGA